MLHPEYPLFTLCMLAASSACLLNAGRDKERITFFVTALIYGLVLEKLVVLAFHRYSYPSASYVLTAFDIPLAIALGWSAILYSAFSLGRSIQLPPLALPAFSALFALHIDLSMDAIAIRVPFWSWLPPGPWFGVALINFFGWFWVAFLLIAFFTLAGRLFRNPLFVALFALFASVASLLILLQLWIIFAHTTVLKSAILIALILVSLGVVVWYRPCLRCASLTPFLVTLPFHGFFLGLLIVCGFYRETPALVPLSVAMLSVHIALHTPSLLRRRSTLSEKPDRDP
jgi:uncharacterized membrane protein